MKIRAAVRLAVLHAKLLLIPLAAAWFINQADCTRIAQVSSAN